jgi:hemoglobin-like flavoprotein
MLPDDQRALIEVTYREFSLNLDAAGLLFYERLFELDPALRPLFKLTMMDQGRKLMQTIGVVVAGMHMPETLQPALLELGKRHVSYGVKPEYYAIVGEALLHTLERVLAEKFTHNVKVAWGALYQEVVLMVRQPAA